MTSYGSGNSFDIHFKRSVWDYPLRKITFKGLSYRQYRVGLYVIVILNCVQLASEIATVIINVETSRDNHAQLLKNSDDMVFAISAAVLAIVNIVIIGRLICRPSVRLAMSSFLIILVLEIIYIIQTVIYFRIIEQKIWNIAVTILFIMLQLLSAIFMYRFWEFVLYNYDEGMASPDDTSDGDQVLDGSNSLLQSRDKSMHTALKAAQYFIERGED